jgi:hypothetical protein
MVRLGDAAEIVIRHHRAGDGDIPRRRAARISLRRRLDGKVSRIGG